MKILIAIMLLSITYMRTNQTIETVQIGEQVWMTKNLNVDIFRNGDKIMEAASFDDWVNLIFL